MNSASGWMVPNAAYRLCVPVNDNCTYEYSMYVPQRLIVVFCGGEGRINILLTYYSLHSRINSKQIILGE